MTKKQKLELTWVGKASRPRLEPRILIEDAGKSYHAAARVSDDDIFDNVLIHGDNLLALKALEADYAGKVKCVFIDPPYNTGSAFEHYDDGLEHSIWLGLMRDRLEVHTVPVFIAAVGGLVAFGATGVVLGPIVLALGFALLEIWRRRMARRELLAGVDDDAPWKPAAYARSGARATPRSEAALRPDVVPRAEGALQSEPVARAEPLPRTESDD